MMKISACGIFPKYIETILIDFKIIEVMMNISSESDVKLILFSHQKILMNLSLFIVSK